MAIKKYKPTSPGRRGMSSQDFSTITKGKPEKKLLEKKTKSGGRNNRGRTTSRFDCEVAGVRHPVWCAAAPGVA